MKLLYILSLIFTTFQVYANNSNVESKKIIYFCGNNSEFPWEENAELACRGSFYPAVLGLLFYIDHNAEINTLSLESFSWDYNNNYYKLRLKKDLYFHNNRKVNSKDLEFSILRHFFSKYPNIGDSFQINLKGTEKIKKGQPYQSGLVEGLKILDDRTIAITPSKSNPSFLYTLTHFSFSLVPIEELNSDLITWKKWPVGVGAYKVTEHFKKDKSFLLELVDPSSYPNAPKEILYEQIRINEPDISNKDYITSRNKKYIKEELLAPLYRRLIEFNYSSDLAKSKDFRKAIAYAISREELSKVTNILTNPLYELLTSSSIGRINIKENQNLNEAIKIIKSLKLSSEITIPFSEDSSYLGEKYRIVLKGQLNKIGLKIKFKENVKNLWDPFTKEFKNSPFYLHSTEADYYDPILNFTNYRNGSPSKNAYPDDKLIQNLLDESQEAPSRDILNERLKNISRYFYEQRVLIPLFEIPNIVYYNPEKISCIGTQFGGVTLYLQNIKIKN